MGKTAFLFPGQGSQYVGMCSDLNREYQEFRDVMREADERLGFSLSGLCFDGPEKELTLTANTQPALLACSVGIYRLLEAEGLKPDVVAGHSLGEYSAMVAAGALSLSDAVFVVRRRGELMQQAVPVGEGTMAAILGLEAAAVKEICAEAAKGEGGRLANINCPGQMVIAGHVGAVGRAVGLAKERGAKRAVELQVSAPFHCSLMTPAQEGMRDVLAGIGFSDLEIPLINNADVEAVESAEAARGGLIKQVVSTVRWEETVRAMLEMGVDTFVEVGPGKVLSGLVRRVDRQANCLITEDVESLGAAIAELQG